jgi:hypothetical protein
MVYLFEFPLDFEFALALLTELLESLVREIDIVLATTFTGVNDLDGDILAAVLDLDLFTTRLTVTLGHTVLGESTDHIIVIVVTTARGLTRVLDAVISGSTRVRATASFNSGSGGDGNNS